MPSTHTRTPKQRKETTNVVNMDSLFMYNRALEMVIFGPNFNIDNTMNIYYMFYSCDRLKVIYAKNDFNPPEGILTNGIFQGCWVLVGGYETSYKTTYKDSTNKVDYAKISNSEQNGYFTYYEDYNRYFLNYNLNGGSTVHDNSECYGNLTIDFKLYEPEKNGYLFDGWSSYSGEDPVPVVKISNTMSGNKTYTANYVESDTVFNIPGSCTFNGSEANITGDDCINIADPTNPISYTNDKYIDTQINLYDSTNFNKNYEITFTISNYSPNDQVNQATIMNSKVENSSLGYPGIAFRRGGDGYLELTQTLNRKKASASMYYSNNYKVSISRKNGYITYKINDYELNLLQDMRTYTQQFVQSLWFGAASDGSGGAQRHFVGTLSNIVVKLER